MKISLVMPTFKHHQFIKKSIKSILVQTHSNLELVVVPVIEDIKTLKILGAIRDKRVRIVPSNFALITHQMNLGIQSAKSEYFMLFASDDFLYKDSLEKTLRFSLGNNAVITYPDYHVGNTDLSIRRKYRAKDFRQSTILSGNYITDVSLVKKDAFMKYFPMKVSDGKSRIYRIWKALAGDKKYSSRIVHYAKPTFIYRQHRNSIHLKDKSQKRFKAVELICPGVQPSSELPKKSLQKLGKSDFAVYLHSPKEYVENSTAFKYKKVIVHWRTGDIGMFDSELFHRIYNVVDSDDMFSEMTSLGARHLMKLNKGDISVYVVEDNIRDLSIEEAL